MSQCTVAGCTKKMDRNGLCQMHHWRKKHHGSEHYQPWAPSFCTVEGCERPHKGNGMCALHLVRKRKGLPLDFEKPTLAAKRYRVLTRKDHPLAWPNGRVLEHRMVLYDAIGPRPVPCYWCGTPLTWDILFVDHKDHDRHNNDLTNLLPTCNSCNAGRTISTPKNRTSVYA